MIHYKLYQRALTFSYLQLAGTDLMIHFKQLQRWLLYGLLLLSISVFLGAYPQQHKNIRSPAKALQPVYSYPKFRDDLDYRYLTLAIQRNIEYLRKLPSRSIFVYGPHKFTCRQVLESQKAFLAIVARGLTDEELNSEIRKHFRIYRAAGRSDNRKVLFTGYYEPVFEASLKRSSVYRYPIYRKPADLIKIDLTLFDRKYRGQTIVGRFHNNSVQPYYTRFQIEGGGALEGKGLEIAWLKDRLDTYLLHVQGAGQLRLPDGDSIYVGYEASNGRKYRSFGKYLMDNGLLSPNQMGLKSIRQYLSRHPKVVDDVLNHNESYTFFEQGEQGPMGNINVQLTRGRSLALDDHLFPKGALAFISTKKPRINSRGKIAGWTSFSRFVLNQDTGSAIKGAGRADLYWGSGPSAGVEAWHIKHDGDLYVLIKNR